MLRSSLIFIFFFFRVSEENVETDKGINIIDVVLCALMVLRLYFKSLSTNDLWHLIIFYIQHCKNDQTLGL